MFAGRETGHRCVDIDPTQLQVIKVTTPAQNPPSTSWFVNVSWPKIMEAMSKFGQKTNSGCLWLLFRDV